MAKFKIDEEMGLHKHWKIAAKKVSTPMQLANFADVLLGQYEHDYGTIVHAAAALMIAAFNVVNESEDGGITGFQASCLGWEMVRKFMGHEKSPMRLMVYEDFLYPQHVDKYRTISPETAAWLVEEAKKHLADTEITPHPAVKEHWEKVAAGMIPFGFTVKE